MNDVFIVMFLCAFAVMGVATLSAWGTSTNRKFFGIWNLCSGSWLWTQYKFTSSASGVRAIAWSARVACVVGLFAIIGMVLTK
jgi:hypothetical protein